MAIAGAAAAVVVPVLLCVLVVAARWGLHSESSAARASAPDAPVVVAPESDAPAAPPPETAPTRTPAAASAPAPARVYPDLRGVWNTEYGAGQLVLAIRMEFHQNFVGDIAAAAFHQSTCRDAPGMCCMGSYANSDGSGEGTFWGVLDSEGSGRFMGEWTDVGGLHGGLAFTFAADAQSFTGFWTDRPMNQPNAHRVGSWNGARGTALGTPSSPVAANAFPVIEAPRPLSRIERDLAACDVYVAEVRARRARMLRLQRAGSDNLYEVMERNQAWLERQENGPFGRAIADLGALMERWQEQEDDGASTIRSRAQLVREVEARCQP